VNSFSEALAYELRGSGVTATVSCPGATATEIAGIAGSSSSLLFRLGAAPKGKPMVIHGLKNKLTIQSLRISPRAVARAVAASLNPRPAEPPASERV
jgi:short-subunit dehydrogenase